MYENLFTYKKKNNCAPKKNTLLQMEKRTFESGISTLTTVRLEGAHKFYGPTALLPVTQQW